MRQDVYDKVTHRIIEQLEQGVRPWMKPWSAGHADGKIIRPLRHNGIPYNGVNVILLWMESMEKGYTAPIWMTFKQALELGGHVRKGERGSMVVYANTITRTETDDATGEEKERDIPFMKGYTVFNVQQIEKLPQHYYSPADLPPRLDEAQRIECAEAFLNHIGASVSHGGNRAFYSALSDHIQMPPFEFFDKPESYYETRLHETVHWTKHPARLNREFGKKKWGDEGYAMEELVAEIGSAFLAADLRLTPEVREDHAAYIDSWLKVLKEDKRAIFSAASHAQKAADHLHSYQPDPEPEPDADASPDAPDKPQDVSPCPVPP
jgi:antirestriction protein ArdC